MKWCLYRKRRQKINKLSILLQKLKREKQTQRWSKRSSSLWHSLSLKGQAHFKFEDVFSCLWVTCSFWSLSEWLSWGRSCRAWLPWVHLVAQPPGYACLPVMASCPRLTPAIEWLVREPRTGSRYNFLTKSEKPLASLWISAFTYIK